ncbi:MAG: NTP transferase domain-containing protein [Candidatus Aureabacteria bacterium]|nr:NTP transferase domain-containing protein [Candidatus Auribacterota bacterium]
MKGIILAGGLGTRLHPLTRITNKHLLPIYSKPMIYYPLEKLVQAGIKDILIVTGGNFAGDFLMLLGNGKEFGLKEISYAYQEGQGGIAEALGLAEHFADNDSVVVILGDNIIEDDLSSSVKKFERQPGGARIFLKEVQYPQRFGVPVFKKKKIVRIEEKPAKPKSPYAVTGIYMYDSRVFDIIKTLKPSRRGELEITDVNNTYIRQGKMHYDILKGFWSDAGTFESLFKANDLIRKKLIKGKKLFLKGKE